MQKQAKKITKMRVSSEKRNEFRGKAKADHEYAVSELEIHDANEVRLESLTYRMAQNGPL